MFAFSVDVSFICVFFSLHRLQGSTHSPSLADRDDDEHASIANLSTALVQPPDQSSTSPPTGTKRSLPSSSHIGADLSSLSTPRSPLQIVSQIDDMQREELDQILRQLELDNK